MTAEYVTFRPGDREIVFRGFNDVETRFSAVGADGRGLRTIVPPFVGDGSKPLARRHEARLPDLGRDPGHHPRRRRGHWRRYGARFDPPASAGLADDKPTWSPDGTELVFVTTAAAEPAERRAGDRRPPRSDRSDDDDVCLPGVVRLLAGRLEGPRALRRRRIDLAARPDGHDQGHAASDSRHRRLELAAAGALTAPIRTAGSARRPACRSASAPNGAMMQPSTGVALPSTVSAATPAAPPPRASMSESSWSGRGGAIMTPSPCLRPPRSPPAGRAPLG